jgi:hypothetical protein
MSIWVSMVSFKNSWSLCIRHAPKARCMMATEEKKIRKTYPQEWRSYKVVSCLCNAGAPNAGLQLRRAISIQAEGNKGYLRTVLSHRQMQGFVRRRFLNISRVPIYTQARSRFHERLQDVLSGSRTISRGEVTTEGKCRRY